jgi:hypothetical protein
MFSSPTPQRMIRSVKTIRKRRGIKCVYIRMAIEIPLRRPFPGRLGVVSARSALGSYRSPGKTRSHSDFPAETRRLALLWSIAASPIPQTQPLPGGTVTPMEGSTGNALFDRYSRMARTVTFGVVLTFATAPGSTTAGWSGFFRTPPASVRLPRQTSTSPPPSLDAAFGFRRRVSDGNSPKHPL